MTIVTMCNEQKINQLMRQLDKLVDVVNVQDLTEETHIEREMLLLNLNAIKIKERFKRTCRYFQSTNY